MPYVDPLEGAVTIFFAHTPGINVWQDISSTVAADEEGDPVLSWRPNGIISGQLTGGSNSENPTITLSDDRTGLPAIVHDHTAGNDGSYFSSSAYTTRNHFTFFSVLRLPTLPTSVRRRLVSVGGGIATGSSTTCYLDSSDNITVDRYDDATPAISQSIASLGLALGDWFLLTVQQETNDDIVVRVNGNEIGTSTSLSLLGAVGPTSGGDAVGNNESNMRQGTQVLYNGTLNAGQLLLVETHMLETYVNVKGGGGPTDPPPLTNLTYLEYRNSTATVFSYDGMGILDQPSLGTSVVQGIPDHDSDEQQFRVFRNRAEINRPGTLDPLNNDVGDYTVDETAKTLTLSVAMTLLDELVIVRQTRQDQSYVDFTPSARLKKSPDFNLFIDQVLNIIQELQEQSQLNELLGGNIAPDVADRSNYTVTTTNSTATVIDYSSISLLADHSFRHIDQFTVIKNGTLLEAPDDYTVSASAEEVTLVVALITSDTLAIERNSPRTRIVPSVPEGSSFSSEILQLQFDHIQNLIEELPLWVGIGASALVTGTRNPRRKSFITYSGPGDRFYYGNLPYLRDGDTFVWVDNVLQTEDDDYYDDDWQWIIDLLSSLSSGDQIIISTRPNCPFPALFCTGRGDFGNYDPNPGQDTGPVDGEPTGPTSAIPAVVVPVTDDEDTGQGADFTTLQLTGATTSEIRLHWDLEIFRNRTATAVTFGLFNNQASMGAGDDVEVYITDSDWVVDSGQATIASYDITDSIQGTTDWHVSDDFTSAINTRLADDAQIYLVVRGVDSSDVFTAWAEEGTNTTNAGAVFGPYMSFEGALYPSPGKVGKPVGELQMTVLAQDTDSAVGSGSTGFFEDISQSILFGSPSHQLGGRSAGGGLFDPQWHEIQFIFPSNITAGATIHSAIMTCTMTNTQAGAGNLQRVSSTIGWNSYSDFDAVLTGIALTGPASFGVNNIDVTPIIQEIVDAGLVNGVSLYHYGGPSLVTQSTMTLGFQPNVPSLFIDYTL